MPSDSRMLLKRLAVDLAALCSDPEDLGHTFDLLNASYSTAVAQAARNRLKADPAIQPLIAERYWGHWPALSELMAMPAGSLGHVYGMFMSSQGLDQLPDPELPADVADEDTYLQVRIRRTHDIWHVIAGLPISLAGEAATNGLTTEQLRWPGSALLIAADLIHRVSVPDAGSGESNDVDLGVAVAHGLTLGATAPPLLAQRWEEGWERPLQSWREELGLTALIKASPFGVLPGELPAPSAN
jgi:ubiquinone biosynthesis protein COQ4